MITAVFTNDVFAFCIFSVYVSSSSSGVIREFIVKHIWHISLVTKSTVATQKAIRPFENPRLIIAAVISPSKVIPNDISVRFLYFLLFCSAYFRG